MTKYLVAIAYLMHKTPYVFPILGMSSVSCPCLSPKIQFLPLNSRYIGGRKIEHLEANVKALETALSDEHISKMENVLKFDKGFPNGTFVCLILFGIIHRSPLTRCMAQWQGDGTTPSWILQNQAMSTIELWPLRPVIKPSP